MLLIATASGTLLGAINGLLVWRFKLPPSCVTLGTMSVYRGLDLFAIGWHLGKRQPYVAAVSRPSFRYELLGIDAACVARHHRQSPIFAVVMRYTVLGRNLYTAGGNPAAATYTGIDPGGACSSSRTRSAGAIAGLCGYLWVARFAVAYTDIALGFELQVIAACLIGGVAIAGGIGTVAGVVLGCLVHRRHSETRCR